MNATPTKVFLRTDHNLARSLVTIAVQRRAVDPSSIVTMAYQLIAKSFDMI